MNTKKSWLLWIVGIVIFAGVIGGFAHGAGLDETGLKVAWMGGSLAVAALTVFLSYRIKK